MKATLAHVPEKWIPVFRKGHAQTQESRGHPDSIETGCALALHAEQLDLENQRGVRRYHAARAAGAVAECGWDDERALTADLHRGDPFIPAGDDSLPADGKLERLAAVERTVELLA